MNPTQPVAVAEPVATAEQATIGEWGAVDEPAATAPVTDEPVADEPVAAEASVPPVRAKRAKRRRERGSGWRRLAILGGADGSVLDEVPTETPRFVQMFFVLAGTALVSAISMLFALTTGVQVAIWLAVPLALVWAAIIFNLDRFLTATMSSSRSIGKLFALAVPRVAMAALIGFLVAEPLVLQVFHNDIAREVTSTNITHALADQKGVTEGPEKKALDAAAARVNDLENQAATGVVAGTSTKSAASVAAQQTVDDLNKKLDAQQKVIDQARALYQCELTGKGQGTVPGCTGVVGHTVVLDADGVHVPCVEGTPPAVAGDDVPELFYGATSTVGPYTCGSATDGVTCTDAKGVGFKLARASLTTLP